MRCLMFVVLGVLVLNGCADPEPTDLAPAFHEGSGQQAHGQTEYPAGPYGVAKGSVISNYKFVGFPNALKDVEELKEIPLAEYYNPTGDGTYQEGSVMEVGAPKPKALMLSVSAVWCGPCNYEADAILPDEYKKYKPDGGEFFVELADGATPGKAATKKNLANWAQKYEVDYPMAIDPSYQLGALFEADSFPANMIVDTRTMQIVEVVTGAQESGGPFWKAFEKTLAGSDE